MLVLCRIPLLFSRQRFTLVWNDGEERRRGRGKWEVRTAEIDIFDQFWFRFVHRLKDQFRRLPIVNIKQFDELCDSDNPSASP